VGGAGGAWHTAPMADDPRPERSTDDRSLELPSLRSTLGFGRKRGRTAEPAPPVDAPDPAAALPGEPGPETTIGPIGLPETRPEVSSRGEPTTPLPTVGVTVVDEEPEPVQEKPRRTRTRPALHLPGPLVALLTGAVVGLALVGLTAASLHLCSAVRGTSSCGKPGLLLLLAITVAMVFLGSVLLRLAGVDPHGSTSFLGVGLLVVVILLALLPVIFHWWMVIVVPLVAMATYEAAWWLTTTYVEPGERVR
jgi:hypothetical protein